MKTLKDLSHDELFNVIDFIYPFFSEYSKAIGGKQFESQNKREYLAKIIFGIMKGSQDRKDWILDFRDDCSDIMGIKLVSNFNYNGYFYKGFSVSNIYCPSLFLRKVYEDVVLEVKNWLLVAKNGLFYEMLVGNHIPVVQLFWESLFHFIRDTPNIMGSMKFKQYYNMELPAIQGDILKNIMFHVLKSVEEPVWLFETFINNSEISPKDAHSLGFKSYLRYYQLEEGVQHELYQDVFVENKDWTTVTTDTHWKGFLKFLSDSFDRYPIIFRDSIYADFINCQFQKDIRYSSKFTTELAKFLYLDRNIPINPNNSVKLLTLLSFTPIFNEIIDRNMENLHESRRKSFLSNVFFNSSLLDSSILNLQYEIIDLIYNYMDEYLNETIIDSNFSKCDIVRNFITSALEMEDITDTLESTKMIINYIQKFTTLFKRFNRKIYCSTAHTCLYKLVVDGNKMLYDLNEDSHEFQQRFSIFTKLFQNLISKNIDELITADLTYVFSYYHRSEKMIRFLFEQPKLKDMLARYVPLNVNDNLLKIIEEYVGNDNSNYEKKQKLIEGSSPGYVIRQIYPKFGGEGCSLDKITFTDMQSLIVNANDELFFWSLSEGYIKKVSSDGNITIIAGDGKQSYNIPQATTLASNQTSVAGTSGTMTLSPDQKKLYVFHTGNGFISEIDLSTLTIKLKYGNGIGSLSNPANGYIYNGSLYFSQYMYVSKLDISTGSYAMVAGSTSNSGSSPNGTVALSALFETISGLFVWNEDLYIVDSGSYCIKRLSFIDNKVYDFVGLCKTYGSVDGVGISAKFGEVSFPTLHANGTLYVFDGYKVRTVDMRTRQVTTIIGSGSNVFSFNTNPLLMALGYGHSLVIKPSGELLISLKNGNGLYSYKDGLMSTVVSNQIVKADVLPASCISCIGIAGMNVLRNGELIFSCKNLKSILKYRNDGMVERLIGGGTMDIGTTANLSSLKLDISYMVVNPVFDNEIYFITNTLYQNMYKFDTNSRELQEIGKYITYNGEMIPLRKSLFPSFSKVFVNPYNNDVFIAEYDTYQHRITALSNNVTYTFAGTGVSTNYNKQTINKMSANLFKPNFLTFTPQGDVLVVEQTQPAIRIINITTGNCSVFTDSVIDGYVDIKAIQYVNDSLYFMRGFAGNVYKAVGPSSINSYTKQNPVNHCSMANVLIIADGYYYVACGDSIVRRAIGSSTVTKIAGGGGSSITDGAPATSVSLGNGVDNLSYYNGEVYFAYRYSHVVCKITNGTIRVVLGVVDDSNGPSEGPTSQVRLSYPSSVAIDSNGVLYVLHNGDGRTELLRYANGYATVYAGGYADDMPSNQTTLYSIQSIAFNKNGELLFSIPGAVRKISRDGIVSTVIGGSKVYSTFNANTQNTIQTAKLSTPKAMTVDYTTDDLYLSMSLGHVSKLSANGSYSMFVSTCTTNDGCSFSGDGGLAINAGLNQNAQVYFDSSKKELYLVDSASKRIRKVFSNGTIDTIVGTGSSSPIVGYIPQGKSAITINIAVSFITGNGDDIFIADSSIGTSDILRIAGCPTPGWNGDNCEFPMCFGLANYSSAVCSGLGNCTAPDICECVDGFGGSNCQYETCFGILFSNASVCSSAGKCISPNTCDCNDGYYGDDCSDYTCFGIDRHNSSVCSGHGKCIDYNQCQCNNGYYENDCSDFTCFNLDRHNSSVCSGNGVCSDFNNCSCNVGYYETDCSDFSCFGIDRHNSSVCSGNGLCVAFNQCQCNTGYYENDCSDFNCFGIDRHNSSVCSGHGKCVDLNNCQCTSGYYENDCSDFSCYAVDRHNSTSVCSGHGICLDFNNCSCNVGYYETDCSDFSCFGIDRHNSSVCSGNGQCKDYNQCNCNTGYYENDCSDFTCFNIDRHNSSVCSGHGLCVAFNQCQCNTGYYENDCSDFTCFGIDRHNSSVCSGNGLCADFNNCSCNVGYYENDCSDFMCFGIDRHNSSVCSGNGECIGYNQCQCNTGYYENDCSDYSCFGIDRHNSSVCSGHGKCIDYNLCQCNNGYYETDCSDFSCLNIDRHNSSACSGNGKCVDLNNCQCTSGYYENDCSDFSCFNIDRHNSSVCSGNGKCIGYNQCQCNTGYYENDCSDFSCYNLDRHNSSVCSGNGQCKDYNQCQCNTGYYENDCSDFTCFGIDRHNSSVCSGNGKCVGYNQCQCNTGYYETDCSDFSCFNVDRHNTSFACSGHGKCLGFDQCDCYLGYYGSQCENINVTKDQYFCFGRLSNDAQVCSGNGNCTSQDVCKCSNTSTSTISGLNCEIRKCVENYYQNSCSKYCKSEITCSSRGKCSIDGACECFSDSKNGFYMGNNCTSCQDGYFGDTCLTTIIPSIRFSNDGTKLIFKLFAPYYYTPSIVDCSKLLQESSLVSIGSKPSCLWTNKTSGDFTISLGTSNAVAIGSSIGINVLIFNQIESNDRKYVQAIVEAPLDPTPPIAIISTVTTSYSSCAEIQVIGSSSYSMDNQNLYAYKWSILKSPQVINCNMTTPVLNLPSNLTIGDYSVQLIVTSSVFKVDSLPVVYNFTKQSATIPQVGISYSSQVDIQVDRTPYYIKKFVTFSECSENDVLTSSLLYFEWKQLEGPSVNFTVLDNGDLLINSFSNIKPNRHVFEVILSYKGHTSNARLIVNSQEPKFEIGLYQASLNVTHVELSIEIDPTNSLSYYNSVPWIYNCINPVDNTPCETSILNLLSVYSNSKSQFLTIPSPLNYKEILISLQIGEHSGETRILFPQDQSVPIINTISIAPQRSTLTTFEYLSIQLLISLNGQVDGIDSLIHREWLLNNQTIPSNYLLSSANTESSNVILDLSKFNEGTSHVLTCKVTSIVSKLSTVFTYPFSIAVNPKPCSCVISPSTGYALETSYTISCGGCLTKDTTLKFGFIDSKTGLKITLMEGTSSQITLPLPFTGSQTLTLFTSIKDSTTNAKAENTFYQTVKIPTGSTITAIKKKKANWETIYKSLAVGDPKKLVFDYITPTVDAMISSLNKRSVKSQTVSCMNGGTFNEITRFCDCPVGFKKNDCSMTLDEWIDWTSSKWNTSKMIFDTLNSKSENELYTENLISIQTSIMYHLLETNDEVNQDLYNACLNLFRQQVKESLKQSYFTISNDLSTVMFSTFRFIIGTKYSLQGNGIDTPITKEIMEIANDLISLKLRNQLVGIPLKMDLLYMTIITNKLYPTDLSNRKIIYGDDVISFGNLMTRFIPNVDMRKAIYQKVTRQTIFNATTTTTFEKSQDGKEEVTRLIKSGAYSLELDIQNQQLVIPSYEKPISYKFYYIRSMNDSNQVQVIGDITKKTVIQSQVQCSSLCDLEIVSNEYFVCKCGQPTPVFLSENITTTVRYITNEKPNTSSGISSAQNNLGYLALISLIIPVLLSVILCIVFISCKFKKNKNQNDPKNSIELNVA